MYFQLFIYPHNSMLTLFSVSFKHWENDKELLYLNKYSSINKDIQKTIQKIYKHV